MKSPTPYEIKAVRASVGLTQKSMAELLLVPLRTYEKWERNESRMSPPIFELMKIKCERLKINID